MSNGWTGGQYSIFRVVTGLYLFVHFAQLVPWATELFSNRGVLPDGAASPLLYLFPNVLAVVDAPWFVVALVVAAAAASLLFAAGSHDRVAAVFVWYVLACLMGRNPLIANPSLPFVGWLLLAHAFIPAAPFGSWAARGRVDPAGGFRLPSAIFGAAWILMAVGYSYSGYTKLISPSWVDGSALVRVLENPLARPTFLRESLLSLPELLLQAATWGALGLELLFAPLALLRRARPWLWLSMLLMHLSLLVLIDFADLTLGMIVLHLFTFDPAWIRPRETGGADRVFYDGSCGLCHGVVRMTLAEDPTGGSFRYAPLDSDAFHTAIAPETRSSLPDSIAVLTANGEVLSRSRAVLHILDRLGGLWRALSTAARITPVAVLDLLYDGIAAIRYKLFHRPDEACPILPPTLRDKFD